MLGIIESFKNVFIKHTLILAYSVIFIFLFLGVYIASGTGFLFSLAGYFILLLIFYFAIFKLLGKRDLGIRFGSISDQLIRYSGPLLFGVIILSVLGHFIHLGYIPVIKAYLSTDYYGIANIRKEITLDTNSFFNYLSSFILKAVIPFSLLYYYRKKQNVFYWIVLAIGTFYSLSMMQKSFIITLVLPMMIYCLLSKKWLYFLKTILIIVGVIYTLLYVTNPQLRNIEIPQEVLDKQREFKDPDDNINRNYKFVYAVYKRLVLVPGKMVAGWFEHVPHNLPHLNGCGYRVLVPFLSCGEYHEYASELYPYINPNGAKRGLKGKVNVASFMNDYANFGVKGFIISAFLIALIFVIIELIFINDFVFKMAINCFYILMLSSSSFTTLLLSGGWFLIIILYFLHKDDLKQGVAIEN